MVLPSHVDRCNGEVIRHDSGPETGNIGLGSLFAAADPVASPAGIISQAMSAACMRRGRGSHFKSHTECIGRSAVACCGRVL